jgi:hypothetical protein
MSKASVQPAAEQDQVARKLPRWLREPIGILPLAVALASLLGLALFFFAPQLPPQLYTAVTAAMAAMLGALVSATYNAQLARRRDNHQEHVKVIGVARVAVDELSQAHSSLRHRVAFIRKKVVRRTDPETAELKARNYVILEWNIRGIITQLATLDLATPELDKHYLGLCLPHSIAKPLLEFRRLRTDMAIWLPSLFDRDYGIEPKPDEMDAITLELEEWTDMLNGFYEIHIQLNVLVPALNSFLERHADDFD